MPVVGHPHDSREEGFKEALKTYIREQLGPGCGEFFAAYLDGMIKGVDSVGFWSTRLHGSRKLSTLPGVSGTFNGRPASEVTVGEILTVGDAMVLRNDAGQQFDHIIYRGLTIAPKDTFHEMTHIVTGMGDVALFNRYGEAMNLHLLTIDHRYAGGPMSVFQELDRENRGHRSVASWIWAVFLENDCKPGRGGP